MKKLYLTKKENNTTWNYVGDPINANTTFDVGIIIGVTYEEMRVDQYGVYIEREFLSEPLPIIG